MPQYPQPPIANRNPFFEWLKQARRDFSRIGASLCLMVVVWYALATVLEGALYAAVGGKGETPNWVTYVGSGVPLYLIAMPIAVMLMGKSTVIETRKFDMKPGLFFKLLLMCLPMMWAGSVFSSMLSMDARMTICNMSIEAGARAGMIAPDEVTFEYLKGRPHAPEGEMWDKAVEYWKTLKTDDDAVFDKEVTINAEDLEPYVTWGTNPGQGVKISGVVPDPASFNDETERSAAERAIAYMGLKPGMAIKDIAVDTVFIGSCTNGRLEDLRVAASIMKGHHKADNIHRVLVVPASSRVRLQAEKEGLDKIFKDFGAEWRNAGCSMCLGMNPDKMVARERSISTSNRNFEGRQGKGSRTHLASPAVAAATAIRGTICSPADL